MRSYGRKIYAWFLVNCISIALFLGMHLACQLHTGRSTKNPGSRMQQWFRLFEKMMIFILMIMMGIVLLLATLDLGWTIYIDLISPPAMLLDVEELIDIFGLFLLVVIGIELLDSLYSTYIREGQLHYEVVLLVALIAIARKVIIIDVKEFGGMALVGIAAVIIALTAGFYLMRKSMKQEDGPPRK